MFKSSKLLNKQLAQYLFNNVDNFLFDCDGVIWNWPHLIPGSIEFINMANKMGKKCFFVTNNSTRTRHTFAETLKKFGVNEIDENQIVCTAWILAEYLKSLNFREKCYLIGNNAMTKELDNSGIKHNAIDENMSVSFNPTNYDSIKLDPKIGCVCVGIDYEFNFQKMIYASSYVKTYNCHFLATNDDSCLPIDSNDIVVPDAGPILFSIQKATGKNALIIGKPNKIMWEILSKAHNLDPTRTCMIGDRLDTDILFAFNSSLKFSLLVLSGITKNEDILDTETNERFDHRMIPDFHTNSLGEFLNYLD